MVTSNGQSGSHRLMYFRRCFLKSSFSRGVLSLSANFLRPLTVSSLCSAVAVSLLQIISSKTIFAIPSSENPRPELYLARFLRIFDQKKT